MSKQTIFKVFLGLLSGFFLFLSFPSYNLSFLQWIAFVPLLFAIENCKYRQVYLLALIMGMVAVSGGFYWVSIWATEVVKVPVPLNHLTTLIYSFCIAQVFGLIFIIFKWLDEKKIIASFYIFPVVFVTVFSLYPMEFYFKLGDAQTYLLPVIQGIDIAGVYGLDFIILLVNIMIFKLIQIPRSDVSAKAVISGLLILAVWLGYGFNRLSYFDQEIANWQKKTVGIIQPNRKASLSHPEPEKGYSRTYPLEIEMTERLAKKGAEVVFWPEGNFFGYYYWQQVRDAFKTHINEIQTPVVFHDTTFKMTGDKKIYHNSSIYLNSNGDEAGIYHKKLLVPFGEYTPLVNDFPFVKSILGEFLSDLSPGEKHESFPIRDMKIVPKLCYESLFSEEVAESIGDEPGKVILIQSQDGWYGKSSQPEQHLTSSALRAVENRVPLVHAINNGVSGIIMPNGRYLFKSPFYQSGAWNVEMPFNKERGGSFYSSHPYLFVYFLRTLFIIFVFWGILKSIKTFFIKT